MTTVLNVFRRRIFFIIRNPRNHYFNPTDGGIITSNPNTWTEPPTLKAIYDPCPYGYRVPPSSSFSGFPTSCDPWTNGDITGGWTTNSSWWGSAGLREFGDAVLGRAATECSMWSSSDGIRLKSTWFVISDGLSGFGYGEYAYGITLRCIPE